MEYSERLECSVQIWKQHYTYKNFYFHFSVEYSTYIWFVRLIRPEPLQILTLITWHLEFTYRCSCGLSLPLHTSSVVDQHKNADNAEQIDTWSVNRHTSASPTDAYGTIEFQGGPHPTKAQVSRRLFFSNFLF